MTNTMEEVGKPKYNNIEQSLMDLSPKQADASLNHNLISHDKSEKKTYFGPSRPW